MKTNLRFSLITIAVLLAIFCVNWITITIEDEKDISLNLRPASNMVQVFGFSAKERVDYMKENDLIRMEAEYEFNRVYDELRKEKEQAKPQIKYQEMPVYSNSSVKRYMDYMTISDPNSLQWRITRQEAVCNSDGVLETKDGYICVALGQKYGKVGDKFLITIGGKNVKCIMADAKAYCDTKDGEGWLDPYGDILEIVVNGLFINQSCRAMGNMDYCNNLSGPITRILKEV